ncbi:thiol-activated cytolysin family protein [Myroides sp. N17-2]|uniref:thiol-activated cytolysin family protein n=1 Tax=Myroides sp. N17-2 TaxID=2030799 RepID=UPI000EFAC1D1|nr:thiol-activated cytolysin family protein [Myroides sp. N17-2]
MRLFAFLLPILLLGCSKTDDNNLIKSKIEDIQTESNSNVIKITEYLNPSNKEFQQLLNTYRATSLTSSSYNTLALNQSDLDFFDNKYIISTDNPTIPNSLSTIVYPGIVFEGGDLVQDLDFQVITVNNKLPITITSNILYNEPKTSSKTLNNPSRSAFDQYINEVTRGAVFDQSESFKYSIKQFNFYDELKRNFGSNINTQKLFSSYTEHISERSKSIAKKNGFVIDFTHIAFTVSMDLAKVSSTTIKGNTTNEPLMISSISYGRKGILTLETDYSSSKVNTVLEKVMKNILQKKREKLEIDEEKIFSESVFKILVIGGDGRDLVHTFSGLDAFYQWMANDTFTEYSYGVPIKATYNKVNTLESKIFNFEVTTKIRPLFVHIRVEEIRNSSSGYNYDYSANIWLDFYEDREKSIKTTPSNYIEFFIDKSEKKESIRGEKVTTHINNSETITHGPFLIPTNSIYIGQAITKFSDLSGPNSTNRKSENHSRTYTLKSSPFFIKI